METLVRQLLSPPPEGWDVITENLPAFLALTGIMGFIIWIVTKFPGGGPK